MRVQVITTPGGERLVVLPEKDFLAVHEPLEDKRDVEIVESSQRRLAAGEEELIPADIVHRMLDGENKVRVWREHRGIPAKDLAEKAGISTADLSQIETGALDGSFDTIRRIAGALRISVDDLA